MKNVLVTGGAGFIGGHIVDELINRGKNVIVIDNESSSSADQYHYNESATYFKHDITDYNKLSFMFRDHPPLNVDIHYMVLRL
jgi:UDP-glucose 4-epimerase